MKIKEVVKLTGLTEKTIRFYEDKGLIVPEREEINGRAFRSYSREDVERLNLVADLRKLDFSISDIVEMRDRPEKIGDILKEYCSRASEELAFKAGILKRLEQIKYEDITCIEELDQLLKEVSENRPLPASDTEFEFYRLDGITKEELDGEVIKYKERLSAKFRRKIRNTILLFSAAMIAFAVLSGLVWKITYYMGYIRSFQNELKGRAILIPLFILIFGGLIFAFAKAAGFITGLEDEDRAVAALRICRYSILALVLGIGAGIVISSYSLELMGKMKTEVGRNVAREWNSLYQMTRYADNYLQQEEGGNDYEDGKSYSLYVNQICYNYAFNGYDDNLHTKMYDVLIWCYDPVFKEVTDPRSKIDREKALRLLKDLNGELKEICTYILYKPEDERADLVRFDSSEAAGLRKRIEAFVNEYTNRAESLFAES